MLTIVFMIFIGACVVAGIVISMLAKRRNDGSQPRPAATKGDAPKVGRATGSSDD